MPPSSSKKRKHENGHQHPIDATGVLEAAKMGRWNQFRNRLEAATASSSSNNNSTTTTTNHGLFLSYEDFNELPPGRTFGVVHQIAYHANRAALLLLLDLHPRVDLKLRTKDGRTALQVATNDDEGENDDEFVDFLRGRLMIQTHHELTNKARDGEWDEFFEQLDGDDDDDDDDDDNSGEPTRPISQEMINTVPPGRTWGILHQICYWGDADVLNRLTDQQYFPLLNLELETNEEAPQLPTDIAIGRGHSNFVASLRAKITEFQNSKQPATTAATSTTTAAAAAAATPTTPSVVSAPSCAMKFPIPAANHLCNICYMDEHDEGTLAVCCDHGHHLCASCFSSWVESESDIEANPQNILLNGGRITCVCKKSNGCESPAFSNKLIASIVSDEIYEKYLRARDFVVGKEAVAGALSKISSSNAGEMDAVEQEQIRNMYRSEDGSYSAYMCGQCHFGPIDHGWCNNLMTHHGEKKKKTNTAGDAQVNNSCPKCKWFASNIQSWPRWDGQFQSPNAKLPPSAAPPPPSSMSVKDLKAALKLRGASATGTKSVLVARLQALYDQGI